MAGAGLEKPLIVIGDLNPDLPAGPSVVPGSHFCSTKIVFFFLAALKHIPFQLKRDSNSDA